WRASTRRRSTTRAALSSWRARSRSSCARRPTPATPWSASGTTASRSRARPSTRSSTASTASSSATSRWIDELRQTRVEEAVEELGVALALGRLHRFTHEEPALLLAGLVVAGAVVGDDVGVGCEDLVHDRRQLALVADLREPALLDDLLRSLRLAQALGEHVLGPVP